MSTLLNALSSLANSLSLCLASLSTFAANPCNRLVPAPIDHFTPCVEAFPSPGEEDFGDMNFSTTFHKTVSWIKQISRCLSHYKKRKNQNFLCVTESDDNEWANGQDGGSNLLNFSVRKPSSCLWLLINPTPRASLWWSSDRRKSRPFLKKHHRRNKQPAARNGPTQKPILPLARPGRSLQVPKETRWNQTQKLIEKVGLLVELPSVESGDRESWWKKMTP